MIKIITIYDKLEKDFTHNGLCILDSVIKAEVEEQLNGIYKLELEYPIDSRGKWLNIVEGNIIKASTPMGYQLFRIFKKKKNLNSISCIALHIFYDLIDNFIEDRRPTNMTGTSAIVDLFKGTQYPHSFSVSSDLSRVNTAYIVRKNPVEALLSDDDNSFLSRWGGEIVRDNFSISMKAHRGEDRGVTIRYGKNLIGLEEEIDESNVITRIMPTGLYENDVPLILPEKYIDSPLINKYVHPKVKHIHFTELKVNKEENITEAIVQKMLREKVKELYEIQKVDLPLVNYKVDFIELSKTEEYKEYQILERVWLGDIVTVKHNRLGIDLKSKVISYKWDSLSNRYIGLELGNFIKNIADSMSEQDKKINQASENFQKALTETAKIIEENQDSMDKTIEEVTKTMNSALGGHVLKRNDELLIMDNPDPKKAVKLWRFNLNGLGYSSNGYNGKFETAITMDGTIVGKFLKGEVIEGVKLQGAEIISADNPRWDSDDFIGYSNNTAKLSAGGLQFRSRNKLQDIWNKDFAVDIDGWGISTSRASTPWYAPTPTYGKGKLTIAGPTLEADPLPDGTGGGIKLSGKGINLASLEYILSLGGKFYSDAFMSSMEFIGQIRESPSGFGGKPYMTWTTSDWKYLGLLNGWGSYQPSTYGDVSWCIDSSGFLHLKGMVQGGAIGSVIATIPYPPEHGNQIFTTISSGNSICRLDIDRNGNIKFLTGGNGFVSLNPISYKVKEGAL